MVPELVYSENMREGDTTSTYTFPCATLAEFHEIFAPGKAEYSRKVFRARGLRGEAERAVRIYLVAPGCQIQEYMRFEKIIGNLDRTLAPRAFAGRSDAVFEILLVDDSATGG